MAPLKKKKNIAGDRQLNIEKFFCQTPEPRKIDEGRVTEATPEKMTGADETEERGADCSGEGGCSRTVTAPDTGLTADPCPAGDHGPRPTVDPCPTGDASPTADPRPKGYCGPGLTGNVDPENKNTAKHRTSVWDPEWLNNHYYSPWL